jgi:hypothetical protein
MKNRAVLMPALHATAKLDFEKLSNVYRHRIGPGRRTVLNGNRTYSPPLKPWGRRTKRYPPHGSGRGKAMSKTYIFAIPSLVDFKTSSQLSESYPLQCAGYALMLEEMGFKVRQWIVIRIPKDGTPAETLTITAREDMQFFRETFIHLLEAHKYQVFLQNHYVDQKTRKTKTEVVNEARKLAPQGIPDVEGQPGGPVQPEAIETPAKGNGSKGRKPKAK